MRQRKQAPIEVLAIIPARGGSKRLPGKNILRVGGRPLIAHSIGHAQAARLITRLVVTTDDQAIARVARRYGAEVIARPPELAGDTITTLSALRHVLATLRAAEGYVPELVVTLQPVCPFRDPGAIDACIRRVQAEGLDSLIGLQAMHLKLGVVRDGLFQPRYVEGARKQDLPTDYRENGSLYITRARLIAQGQTLFGGRIGAFVPEEIWGVNIDTAFDYELADALMWRRRRRRLP